MALDGVSWGWAKTETALNRKKTTTMRGTVPRPNFRLYHLLAHLV